MIEREIKFRALDRQMGEWFILSIYELINCESASWCDVDLDTLGEYTGLKDKNGKEIYDGDIQEYEDTKRKFIIKYEPEAMCWCGYFTGVEWNYRNEIKRVDKEEFLIWQLTNQLSRYELDKSIIVGNIYENPELLEELKG